MEVESDPQNSFNRKKHLPSLPIQKSITKNKKIQKKSQNQTQCDFPRIAYNIIEQIINDENLKVYQKEFIFKNFLIQEQNTNICQNYHIELKEGMLKPFYSPQNAKQFCLYYAQEVYNHLIMMDCLKIYKKMCSIQTKKCINRSLSILGDIHFITPAILEMKQLGKNFFENFTHTHTRAKIQSSPENQNKHFFNYKVPRKSQYLYEELKVNYRRRIKVEQDPIVIDSGDEGNSIEEEINEQDNIERRQNQYQAQVNVEKKDQIQQTELEKEQQNQDQFTKYCKFLSKIKENPIFMYEMQQALLINGIENFSIEDKNNNQSIPSLDDYIINYILETLSKHLETN